MSENQPPPSLDKQHLNRMLIGGLVLAFIGVGLFLGLFAAFSDLESAPRLFIAGCVPPAVIALILGVYVLASKKSA